MCLREVRQSPSCGAPINGGPSRPALRRMQGSSSRSGVRQQGCDRQYEVLAGTFIVKAFSAHQPPAVRYKLPKCSASSANTTPVLRTEGFHIPKVRQTFFFFTDQTAIFLLMFQKKNGGLKAASLGTHAGGCYPPLRCAATERNEKNMLPSHGIGTRANIRFVVPPKFKTDCLLWPPVTGREPWAFPPPLRRCPSSDPNGRLSALSPSLWIGGQSTAAASAR